MPQLIAWKKCCSLKSVECAEIDANTHCQTIENQPFWREDMKKLLLTFVMLCICLAACGAPPAALQPSAVPVASVTPAVVGTVKPEMMIKLEPFGENPHLLGGIPTLLTLQPNVAAPNTNVTITMPSELAVLTGSKAWAGDLKANQALYLSIVIQIDSVPQPGFIQVDSTSYPKDAPTINSTYKLYFRPTADGKIEFSQTAFTK
jgi:hypothetical protein